MFRLWEEGVHWGGDSSCRRGFESGQEDGLHSLRDTGSAKWPPSCQCSPARVVFTINPYLWRWQMCGRSLTTRLHCTAIPPFPGHFSPISSQAQGCGDGQCGHVVWLGEPDRHQRVTRKPTAFQKCFLYLPPVHRGAEGADILGNDKQVEGVNNVPEITGPLPPNWKQGDEV